MSDFPQPVVVPTFLNSWSKFTPASEHRGLNVVAAPASATYPAANLAIYIPFYIPWAYALAGAAWANGSATTGNADAGIYTREGTRVVSTGSTARAGASALQGADFAAPVILQPGSYYMALAFSSGAANTGWLNTSVTAVPGRAMGLLQQASAFPLPATMTPAAWTSTGYPLMGFYIP